MKCTVYTINGTTETSETRYFPWGKDRFTSGSTLTSYKFTGQREEAGLGLYYYGARWYDPGLGRFIQPDTIVPNPGDVQSFDRYAYVLNNPLKYRDPTGHTVEPHCPYCNIQWFDYSGTPSWLNTAVDGLTVAGCFFAGCHADTEKDTVTGPTEQEAAYDGMNQVIGVGLTPLGAVTQATSRASRRLIQHGDELLGLSTVPRHVLDNALSGFRNRTLTSSGGTIVTLTKERLGHFLTRHHPTYWGSWQHLGRQVRARNSAFDAGLDIEDVIELLQETLKAPGQRTGAGRFEYIQEINGKWYSAVVENDVVQQFVPCAVVGCQ